MSFVNLDKNRIRAGLVRALRLGGWCALVIVVLCALGMGAFVWRLSVAPMTLSGLKPFVETAFSAPDRDVYARFEAIELSWSELDRFVYVRAQGARLVDGEGAQRVSARRLAFRFGLSDLVLGRFRPRHIIVESPFVRLQREDTGRFTFIGMGADKGFAADGDASDRGVSVFAGVLAQLKGEAEGGTVLDGLERFEIRSAQLYVDDRLHRTEWSVPDVTLALSAQKGGGLVVSADVHFQHGETVKNTVRAQCVVPKGGAEIDATLTLRGLESSYLEGRIFPAKVAPLQGHTLVLDGTARVGLSSDFQVVRASLDAVSDEGVFDFTRYDLGRFAYRDLSIDAAYTQGRGLSLRTIAAKIDDIDVALSGDMLRDGDGDASYHGGVRVHIPVVRPETLRALWPQAYRHLGVYEWLGEKVSSGQFRDIVVQTEASYAPLSSSGSGSDAFALDVPSVVADFQFQDMTVDYNAPMPAITRVDGRGRFDYATQHVGIDVTQGRAGALSVVEGRVDIRDFIAKGRGYADMNIVLDGGVRDVFRVLESEPLAIEHGLKTDGVRGLAQVDLSLQVPVYGRVRVEDVPYTARATISNGVIPGLVNGVDVTDIAARAVVSHETGGIEVEGTGRFVGRPFTFVYNTFTQMQGRPYRDRVKVSGNFDAAAREALGLDLQDIVRGDLGVQALYTTHQVDDDTLTADVDLTSAVVMVPPLGYEKPKGQEGRASFAARLKNGVMRALTGLRVRAPELDIEKASLTFTGKAGDLQGADFPRLKVGASRGRLAVERDNSGRLSVSGQMDILDMRTLISPDTRAEKTPQTQPPLRLSLKADKALTHQGRSVHAVALYVDRDAQGRFHRLEFDAQAGQGAVYLRYKPDPEYGRLFRLEADDAGATLHAFGLFDDMKGGRILVHAEPAAFDEADGAGVDMVGVADIQEFRVVDAPVLAKLLSLASLSGVRDGLSNEGIEFTRLETRFTWAYRPAGSVLVVKDGRTAGAAIGLTFDGALDQEKGMIDLSGTLVPMTHVNSWIRSIPLVGDVLTGGSALIGASYSIEGPMGKEPDVSINPLSVLTPGILRRFLFE